MIKIFLLISLLQASQLADTGVVPVQVHVMAVDEINRIFNDGSKGADRKVAGWAIVASDLSWCHIFVPPLTWQTLGIWRHEFRHCREGPFHE